LKAAGADVFGLSTQATADQQELVARLHLPFAVLSDEDLALAHTMRLPTFEVAGQTLLRRLTMVIRDGRVEHVWYPVFPPDRHAEHVLEWLRLEKATT
jgi:peroxiredoxin